MSNTFTIRDLHVEPGSRQSHHFHVCDAPDGSAISIPLTILNGKHEGPTVYVGAALHGDEPEGTMAVLRAIRSIDPAELAGTVVASPLTTAHAAIGKIAHETSGLRESPIDYKNPMRVFPGKTDGTVTDRIVWALGQEIIPKCHAALELHSGGYNRSSVQMAGFADVEGDYGRRSYELAKAFSLPYFWSIPLRNPEHPGRLQEVCRDYDVPVCGAEVTGMGITSEEDVSLYETSITNVLRHLEMLDGEPEGIPNNRRVVGVEQYVLSQHGGLFAPTVTTGQEVEEGQEVGRILNVWGEDVEVLKAPLTGIVTGLRIKPVIWPGETAFLCAKLTDRGQHWPPQ